MLTWKKHGVVKRFWGTLTDAEVLVAHHGITEDYRFDGHIRYVVSDFSGLEASRVSPEALKIYCPERNGVATYLPNIRGAMIVDNPVGPDLCRLITQTEYATPFDIHEERGNAYTRELALIVHLRK